MKNSPPVGIVRGQKGYPMKEYAIQAYYPEYADIGPWMCLSPTMRTIEEATDILNQINTKYKPKTNREYRIVSRDVTPWVVEEYGIRSYPPYIGID